MAHRRGAARNQSIESGSPAQQWTALPSWRLKRNVVAVNHRVSPVGKGREFNQQVVIGGQPDDAGDAEVRAHRRDGRRSQIGNGYSKCVQLRVGEREISPRNILQQQAHALVGVEVGA